MTRVLARRSSKAAKRFARRERIEDASFWEAIERAERSTIDADLGGGLIKQRVARLGRGRSGAFRMIFAYRAAGRAAFLYGFAKNDRDNIEDDALQTLRTIGANWLAASTLSGRGSAPFRNTDTNPHDPTVTNILIRRNAIEHRLSSRHLDEVGAKMIAGAERARFA